MKIGIDAAALRLPLTGVGSYALYLIEAMLRRSEAPEMAGFDLSWSAWDYARAQAHLIRSSEFDSGARRNDWRRLLRPLKNSPRVGRIYTRVRATRFRSSVTEQRLSLFHAFAYTPPADTPPCPAIPVVYDVSFVRFPHFHPRRRVEALESLGRAIARAPLVHTISEFSAREITDVFGVAPERLRVIVPGVKPVFWSADTTNAGDAVADDRFFLVVSTLEPRKNLRTVIDAYERLDPATRARCPLLVAGTPGWGDATAGSERVDALVREGSLRFLGFVSDERLRRLYRACTAMLYPSIYEGFGMPVIEALAAGARVVSADGSALPEAGGAVVPRIEALDVPAWSTAMREMLDSIDNDISRAFRRDHAAGFRWDSGAAQTLAMYRAALG